jgi:hypothetical protein
MRRRIFALSLFIALALTSSGIARRQAQARCAVTVTYSIVDVQNLAVMVNSQAVVEGSEYSGGDTLSVSGLGTGNVTLVRYEDGVEVGRKSRSTAVSPNSIDYQWITTFN